MAMDFSVLSRKACGIASSHSVPESELIASLECDVDYLRYLLSHFDFFSTRSDSGETIWQIYKPNVSIEVSGKTFYLTEFQHSCLQSQDFFHVFTLFATDLRELSCDDVCEALDISAKQARQMINQLVSEDLLICGSGKYMVNPHYLFEPLEPHPYIDFLPRRSHNEFQALSNQIAKDGLIEPIVLYEGKILDGRTRYQVCYELNLKPRFQIFDDVSDSPLTYVLTKNLKQVKSRVSKGQTACLLVRLADQFFLSNKHLKSYSQALGITMRYINYCRHAYHFYPTQFALCEQGKIPFRRLRELSSSQGELKQGVLVKINLTNFERYESLDHWVHGQYGVVLEVKQYTVVVQIMAKCNLEIFPDDLELVEGDDNQSYAHLNLFVPVENIKGLIQNLPEGYTLNSFLNGLVTQYLENNQSQE